MTQPLHGRRILVTGGASGIGAAAAQVLSDAGAGIVATYHRTPPAEHAGVKWVQCNVRDAGAVDDMVKGAAETLGGLDVLLHAAGCGSPGIPGQIIGEDIDLVDTNLRATIFTNQAAYAVMGRTAAAGLSTSARRLAGPAGDPRGPRGNSRSGQGAGQTDRHRRGRRPRLRRAQGRRRQRGRATRWAGHHRRQRRHRHCRNSAQPGRKTSGRR
jgi:NAD(P)-dependent dehydrogenase (short-subunit alcohol dehydrogenase family)